MFKLLVKTTAALLLSCSLALPALAEITPSATVEEGKAAAEAKCKEGCIVLSPADIAELEALIQLELEKAYQAGLRGWASAS